MSMTEGKIRRWVVYNSPRSGLQVCRADAIVNWVHSVQQMKNDTDAEVGRVVRKFPVISMHTTREEAEAMVKLTKE